MMINNIKHLYVHVPFCKSICSYCDFCHFIYRKEVVREWLSRLQKEITSSCHNQYETIYLGGGTPTSLDDDELEELLDIIKPYSKQVIEYTIEINPETLTSSKASLLKKYGINRASIGVQTTNNDLLKLLNRHHNFDDVKRCIQYLKNNDINNISIDLMYSLPTQTIEILKDTIDDIMTLDISHISIYSLTIEDNTIFKKRNYKPLDDEIEADMYEYIIKRLDNEGFKQYEVANFSKINKESKHNLGYWEYHDFLGVSMGAASKINHQRYTNTRILKKYLDFDDIKEDIIDLSREDEMFEHLMMSLRTSKGVNIENYNKLYNCDLLVDYEDAIKKQHYNLTIEDGYLRCNNLAILNHVLVDFLK